MNWQALDQAIKEFEAATPTMNIHAKNGDLVVYLDKNGHDWEPVEAREKGLVEGMVYTVERTEVGGGHTDVYLREFPGQAFNSVLFRDEKERST
ncbi:hypothetical protein PV433_27170 [Paenibacillus sp. GYB004]|uniref:hypothetical protein n=1 Tax=Paenibacillus sp. GYB004 TaxID=2994393 RepID=UPI002F9653F1